MTNIPPARDIATMISDAALGIFGTNMFVGKEPKEPNTCITIYDEQGEEGQANFSYEKPRVQIRVRGEAHGYTAAYSLIQDIKDALHGTYNVTVGSYRYIGIWAIGSPVYLSQDENERPLFTLTLRIHRTTTS